MISTALKSDLMLNYNFKNHSSEEEVRSQRLQLKMPAITSEKKISHISNFDETKVTIK